MDLGEGRPQIARATHLATVAVERRDSHQRGNLAAAESASRSSSVEPRTRRNGVRPPLPFLRRLRERGAVIMDGTICTA